MKSEKIKEIEHNMGIQKALFNPKKASKKNIDYQFIFKEEEGIFKYYLSIKDKKCSLIKGESLNPICRVTTDIETWNKIGGRYLSGQDAMKTGKLNIEGNILAFIFKYNKIFSGTTDWPLPDNLYINKGEDRDIKNVLVVSSSPRNNNGATSFFADKLIEGMIEAGANVEVIYPAKMKIYPCTGCFKCWVDNSNKCIFHEKDDMKIFWEKYYKSDLIVWATPIYYYHCTTAMKTIIDRFFIQIDPHLYNFVNNVDTHPNKINHFPYFALLAVAGFSEKEVFKPIYDNFKIFEKHGGPKLIAALFRNDAMSFITDGIKNKIMDDILEITKHAGIELIKNKKVSKKTKKIFGKKLYKRPLFHSIGNFYMDTMQQEKRLFFKKES